MGRTRIARTALVELKKRIAGAEKSKKEFSDYLKKANEQYSKGKISYSKYVEIIHEKRNGRNLNEWIDYLGDYKKECENEIKKQKKKIAGKDFLLIFMSLILVISLFAVISYTKINPIGFLVKEDKFSQSINSVFESSSSYQLVLENPGELNSLKISGTLQAGSDGYAKVFLGDLLIYSYSAEGAPQTSPSQEPSSPEINFNGACDETCNLENSGLNQSAYTLRVEISNANLSLDEVEYQIAKENEKSEEVAQPNETQNISQETPAENPPAEENQASSESPEINAENETANANSPELAGNPETTNNSQQNAENASEIPPAISENATENITNASQAENITTSENIPNAAVQTTQYQAVLGKPVKWEKKITAQTAGNLTLEIPKDAEKVSVTKITENSQEDITQGTSITGAVIGAKNRGFLVRIYEWLSGIFGRITGNVVSDSVSNETENENQQNSEENSSIEIPVDEENAVYSLTYETPAPYAQEEDTNRGKIVTIIGPETIHYENVLSFTSINEAFNVRDSSRIKIYWEEDKSYITPVSVKDTDGNGIYDYVEWIAPHLSSQTFEIIIEASKAEHLDSSKNFVSDIYEQIRALDDSWSEEIPSGDYVRITFRQNLTNQNDITLFPKIVSGTPVIEVYEKDSGSKIAEFTDITSNEYNKILLTALPDDYSQDVFDLKISGGSISFDYIVDPVAQPGGTTNLRAQNCTAMQNSTSITYPASCFGTYSSACTTDRLSCNDAVFEWQNASRARAAGVKTHIYNSSITNCGNVTQVIACFAWWRGIGANVSRCQIVASNGTTETNVSVACPAATANPTPTCLNITTNLTWTCNSFFGTAPNKAYLRTTLNISNTTGGFNVSEELLAFNVTYNTDTIAPNISIIYPASNMSNFSTTALNINYSVADNYGIGSCWYSNDTYSANKSLTNCSVNISNSNGVTWTQGQHNITVYANDTVGNVNWSARSFIIDTISPSFTNLANQSIYINQSLNYDINAADSGVGLGTFGINWTSPFSITASSGVLTNTSGLSVGNYYINVSVNDTLGNMNSGIILINVSQAGDSVAPVINSVSSPSTVINGTDITINANVSDNVGVGSVWVNVNGTNYTMSQSIPLYFYDDFESGTLNTNGWNLSSGKTDWNTATTDPFAGTYNAEVFNINSFSYMEEAINASGYNNINFSYYRKAVGFNGNQQFTAEWWNGTAWNSLESITAEDSSYVFRNFMLPSSANNNSNLKIRFGCSASGSNRGCRLDNINVSGQVISPTILWQYSYMTQFLGTFNYTVYANDTSNNLATSVAGNFTVLDSNISIDDSSTNAAGVALNTTLQIIDNSTGSVVYNQTKKHHNAKVVKGNYNIKINPQGMSVQEIDFNNVNIKKDVGNIIDIDNASSNGASARYAFQILTSDLGSYTLTVNMTGDKVYACSNWDFSNEKCLGNWTKEGEVGLGNTFVVTDNSTGYMEIPEKDAIHLDSSKNFISDIYDATITQDGVWSETINDGEYVRVTFSQLLGSENDINLYPQVISGTPIVDVYELDQNISLGEINPITGNQYNDFLLTNLAEQQDTFDLKISGGTLQLDHIVDPQAYPNATSANTNLIAQSCQATQNTTAITYSGSCMGNYPNTTCGGTKGDRVGCNDGIFEWRNASRGRFMGIKVNISNSSISNCASVNQVFVCYEWWAGNSSNLANCVIAINNGTAESNVSVTCPAATANPTPTCLNVTNNLTWNCASFFNSVNRSYIRTQVNRTSNFFDNLSIDVLLFNVTYTTSAADTTAPNISIIYPANMTNSTDRNLDVNYSTADNIGLSACWYSNDSYSANSSLTNCATNLTYINWTEGQHNVTVYVNDTTNNRNWSAISFIIDFNPNINITYPASNMSTLTDVNTDINFTASDTYGLSSCWYSNDSYSANSTPASCSANFTNIIWSYGQHNVTVYANDSRNNLNWSARSFTISPILSAIINSPTAGQNFGNKTTIPISVNISGTNNLSSRFAQVTYPNSSAVNVTLNDSYQLKSDDFSSNSIGVQWFNETWMKNGDQKCYVDINGTYTGKAFTSLNGSSTTSPYSDTYCSIVGKKFLDGDFDINITWNLTATTNEDWSINFALLTVNSSANATQMIYMDRSNWHGQAEGYEVFVNNGSFNDYIETRSSSDTNGKFRIMRTGSNFRFFTWNSSNTWYEEPVSANNFSGFPRQLYLAFESESSSNKWGTVNATWDDFGEWSNNNSIGLFTDTLNNGTYSIKIFANDTSGTINNTETTSFRIGIANNTAPSTPWINTPVNGELVNGIYNVTWTTVTDGQGDAVKFNVTLLNTDETFNSSIVSAYGNLTSNYYTWNTSLNRDGNYSIQVLVYETSTAEHYSVNSTLTGNFTIDNTAPNVNITYPSSGATSSDTGLDVNYTASDLRLSSCWWSNDTYSINNTLANCSTNITSVTWSYGQHNVTVWANDTLGNTNSSSVSFTISSPIISVIINSPNGENFSANSTVPISANITDNIYSISSVIAQVRYPNASWANVTMPFSNQVQSDNFNSNTIGTNWFNETWMEDSDQKCYVNINGTYTGKAFTSLTGSSSGSPYTDTYCSVISKKFIDGDFDINITWNLTATLDEDWSINFILLEVNSSANASKMIYIDRSDWTGQQAGYEIFANDGGFSDYIEKRASSDTNGKFRITRTANIFTFYTWNGTDWYSEPVSQNEFSMARQLYVAFESESSENKWGSVNATWEDFGAWSNNNSIGLFTDTASTGTYNVTIFANDTSGTINNTEKTSFIIGYVNTPPSDPYILTPGIGDNISGIYNITWSNVFDSQGDAVKFNITLLNPDQTFNMSIASAYGNITSNYYTWNTSQAVNGTYTMQVMVYETSTAEHYNNSNILNGNFSINNSAAAGNNPPSITSVINSSISPDPSLGPTAAGASYFSINFTATDSDGNLNLTSGGINFTNSLITRQNTTCSSSGTASSAVFTCNVTMWWFDSSGTWNITAFVLDTNNNNATNASTTFRLGQTTGFSVSPGNLTWSSIIPNSRNKTASNNPVLLNNTGNAAISAGNISISAFDLLGESTSSIGLWANNFSVSWQTGGSSCSGTGCTECAGNAMTNNSYVNLTLANLTAGNYSVNDGKTGQEQLYVCLRYSGSELTAQSYSTKANGAWIIRILVAVLPAGKKKKKKLENEKLLEAFNLIADELKSEYSLGKKELLQIIIGKLKERYGISRKEILETIEKEDEIPAAVFRKELGALEAVVKYMKENLSMNYSEIAKELERDERTIWTSYKKALKKQKLPMEISSGKTTIPLSALRNKKLTVLESAILYLKNKGMKYSEIGKLLNRDERNIWTAYSRILKKIE